MPRELRGPTEGLVKTEPQSVEPAHLVEDRELREVEVLRDLVEPPTPPPCHSGTDRRRTVGPTGSVSGVVVRCSHVPFHLQSVYQYSNHPWGPTPTTANGPPEESRHTVWPNVALSAQSAPQGPCVYKLPRLRVLVLGAVTGRRVRSPVVEPARVR